MPLEGLSLFFPCRNEGGNLAALVSEALDALPALATRYEVIIVDEHTGRLMTGRRWSDGLPIVPPTRERVARMLAHTQRKPDELIAKLAPGFGEATVERIAVNAVMAGCDPEYLPLLLAAASAVAEPLLEPPT